jgi:cytochrome d ubiquinol oxidase subunit I
VETLDLSRWQFAITTIYHFFFVPLTLGLSILVAVMQTMYVRTGEDTYKRMTRFWGRLFIINFILGVATGIVQEFQFGMNWSEYSRFVGDIFGAPLAIEALLAFFLESTFLGIWIFGWDRLDKRLHLATIWLVALGSNISALWILIANSFMQQPVGYAINDARGRAEMNDFGALLTNPNVWVQWPHVFTAGVATAAFFVLGICAYHLLRQRGDLEVFRRSSRIALVAAILSTTGVALVGHTQAQHMVQIQPMKMAAAEALWEDTANAPLSLFTWGDEVAMRDVFGIHIPSLVSIMAYNDPSATVRGINSLQREYQAQYGAGDYVPQPIWIIYWSFRAMIGAGVLMIVLAALGLWYLFRGTLEKHRWFLRVSLAAIALPYLANATGWVLTEVGRQPWIVNGLMKTEAGVSPLPAGAVLLSLVVFTLLYGVLAVVDVFLLVKFARGSAGETPGVEPAPGTEMAGVY